MQRLTVVKKLLRSFRCLGCKSLFAKVHVKGRSKHVSDVVAAATPIFQAPEQEHFTCRGPASQSLRLDSRLLRQQRQWQVWFMRCNCLCNLCYGHGPLSVHDESCKKRHGTICVLCSRPNHFHLWPNVWTWNAKLAINLIRGWGEADSQSSAEIGTTQATHLTASL